MMRFALGLEKPDPQRVLRSALTIAGAYIVGGCIPLGPYIVSPKASTALVTSVTITLLALAMFGYVKGHFTGAPPWRSAMQTMLIGGVAAGVAFGIARAISCCECPPLRTFRTIPRRCMYAFRTEMD